MKVKDILDVICKAEGVTSFKDIPLKRVKEFQEIDLGKQIEFIEDKDYKKFYDELQSIFESRVNRPTAMKILNNAYVLSLKKLNDSNTQ
ncbi:hypothetical protein [Intestinibacter bartlettii]|uniref:hypothetical protein n=1 Tax=Intestinibacter bartlettii TaxID=261299 RepID=UPI0024312723|nr:hypothetical protein [Intestinibacter bartlettii]